MTTPEGFTAKIAAFKPNPTDRTLDVRSGFQWKIRGNDIKTFSGINGTLNLWLLGSGQIVLTYERNSMRSPWGGWGFRPLPFQEWFLFCLHILAET